jgi:quercetin dioxygenase-like cupin family protein
MSAIRIFNSSDFFQPTDGEPIRSVVTESKNAVVVAWYINPGQEIPAHIHPNGQDTWTVLSGKGEYYLDKAGTRKLIAAGDVVIAHTGCVHGVFNSSDEPLVFISVVSPSDAGYELVPLVDLEALEDQLDLKEAIQAEADPENQQATISWEQLKQEAGL